MKKKKSKKGFWEIDDIEFKDGNLWVTFKKALQDDSPKGHKKDKKNNDN